MGLTKIVVLPVLRRHWALHATRCAKDGTPPPRNAFETAYDRFARSAAKRWAQLQDAEPGTARDYARKAAQTLLDASRDPEEAFLVVVGGGRGDANPLEVRHPAALPEKLVRRRLRLLSRGRHEEHLWRSRAWLASAPVLAPLLATPITKWPIVYAAWRWKENSMATKGADALGSAPMRFVADPALDALLGAEPLAAAKAERAVPGVGGAVAHKLRWLGDRGLLDDDDDEQLPGAA